MNTLIRRVWCLFALHLVVPASTGDRIQIVKEPTGKAVQAALDACAAQGGGVAYLPPGRYVSGPLWLKDNGAPGRAGHPGYSQRERDGKKPAMM